MRNPEGIQTIVSLFSLKILRVWSSTKRKTLCTIVIILLCAQCWVVAAPLLNVLLDRYSKMHEKAFGHYLIAHSCWCCMRGNRLKTFSRCQMGQMPVYLLALVYCRMSATKGWWYVQESPRLPNSIIISATASDRVTTMMHERALVHDLIVETCNNGRSYQKAPALQSCTASPLRYMSAKSQHRCIGGWWVKANNTYTRYPRCVPITESIDILDPWYFPIKELVDILAISYINDNMLL